MSSHPFTFIGAAIQRKWKAAPMQSDPLDTSSTRFCDRSHCDRSEMLFLAVATALSAPFRLEWLLDRIEINETGEY